MWSDKSSSHNIVILEAKGFIHVIIYIYIIFILYIDIDYIFIYILNNLYYRKFHLFGGDIQIEETSRVPPVQYVHTDLSHRYYVRKLINIY